MSSVYPWSYYITSGSIAPTFLCGIALEVVEEATEEVELFSSVSETVYATTTVNVRDTYSASGNQLGSLTTAQSVTRTGIGTGAAEGWSRIEFNGAEAYVKSDYLSTTKPVTSTPSSGNSGSSTTTKPSSGSSSATTTPSTPSGGNSGSSTTQTPPPTSSAADDNILGSLEEDSMEWANSSESGEWGSAENADNSYVPPITLP
ncbi:SH3 domain-containing protein [Candidatus Avoscillospira sp. LCP25S3_F1]|uniref:SH3 domain-containing protein n=1 Tax=Candidatus Avoscillospira sp. LCP25S3_F1 TaxID=3438825 RepID=UPI003F93A481